MENSCSTEEAGEEDTQKYIKQLHDDLDACFTTQRRGVVIFFDPDTRTLSVYKANTTTDEANMLIAALADSIVPHALQGERILN